MRAWPPPTAIGTVTSLDYWASEVAAGRCFIGTQLLAPAGGQFACFQVMNPAGSTITVSLYAVHLPETSTTGLTSIRRHDTQLATDVAAGVNLLAGGAAGQAHFRTDVPAALPGTRLGYSCQATANPIMMGLPVWLGTIVAGQGLVAALEVAAAGCACTMLWREG